MAEVVSCHLLQGVNFGWAWHVVSVGCGIHPVGPSRVNIVRRFMGSRSAKVFPDGDEFHFRGNNALTCIPELGYRVTDPAEGLSLQPGIFLQLVPGFLIFVESAGMLIGDITIVFRAVRAPLIFLNVTAFSYPTLPKARKALGHLTIEGGVSPWA